MIIPKYLKNIVIVEKLEQYSGSFKIKCICGCDKFILYKNIKKRPKISKENQKKIRETEMWKDKVFSPLVTNYGDCRKSQAAAFIDHPKENYREIVIYDCTDLITKFDLIKDKDRIVKIFKVNYGEVPLSVAEINAIKKYDFNTIIKAKCSLCNKEHTLYDSRIHGCDAIDFNNFELEEYDFKEMKIKGETGIAYNVTIDIKNFWDDNEKIDFTNDNINVDFSNMINYIKIQVTNESTYKKTVFSEELG